MNKDQLLFINSDIRDSILIGNPGCGKTRTIIEYCINKFANKLIESNKNFLIISFSKSAQLDFIKRGKQSTKPDLFNNSNVRTIHSLASDIFNKLFKKSSKNINTIILATYKNLLEHDDFSNVLCLANCKYIIIDEAQDINENQYNLIKLIANKLNIPLILVGDPNQNIFQFQGGSDKYLMNHSTNVYNLTYNYRSTNQIVKFCNYIRPYDYLPEMVSAKDSNNVKPLIYCNNVNNILVHIKNELLKNDYNLEDIAIIGPVKLSKPINGIYINIGLQLICNYLDENNIKFIKHFKDPGDKDFSSKEELQLKPGYVNILTSHGCKGLEFKKTLVVNYHFTTFTKRPTEKEYNIFKYLWYVSLSRSIEKLIIYVDSNRFIFPEIAKIPKELYDVQGKSFKLKNNNFEQDFKPLQYTVTDILDNLDENLLYEFNDKFKYLLQVEQLYDINKIEIFEYNKYSCLYGIFIERLFMFYYYKNKDNIKEFINIYKKELDNILFVDKKYIEIYNNLKKKGIIDNNYQLNFSIIDKNDLKDFENKFINYCKNQISSNIITIYIKSDVFIYDKKYLIKLYDSLLNEDNCEKIIFDIIIYFYQIDNECKYLLNYNFDQHLKSLNPYFIKLDELSKNYNNFKFQVNTKHINFKLYGNTDIVQNNKIIELKFTKNINDKHIIQTLLYYNNINIDWKVEKDLEVWNLLSGTKYKIKFNNNITNWDLNCFICKTLNIKMINNIFMLDLETNNDESAMIGKFDPSKFEIIDRYVYEYNFKYPISDGLIKNITSLKTSHITGITKSDMKNADENLNKFKSETDEIMNYCNKPLFIGHNGNRFDLPILYHYKLLDSNLINTLDSMLFLRLFFHNKDINNKLINIYNYICNTHIEQTHRAKGDTLLIAEICEKLKITNEDLINMCDISIDNTSNLGPVILKKKLTINDKLNIIYKYFNKL